MDINFLAKEFGIPIINPDRNYWLVRSNQGDFYEDFITNEFIALGYNQIVKEDVITSQKEETPPTYLKDKVFSTITKNRYNDIGSRKRAASLISGYIKIFCIEMKKGDIVLIPSKSSTELTFAEIIDDVEYLREDEIKEHKKSNKDSDLIKKVCDFNKKRNISILKTVFRKDIDLKLSQAFFGANTIANLDKYSIAIDRTLSSLYAKNNKLYYKFLITTKENITASNYFDIMYALKTACAECESYTGIPCDFDSLSIKAQAESPGFWQMVFENSNTVLPCLGILGVPVILAGFKLKISRKTSSSNSTDIEFDSDGLLENFLKFYKEHHRHLEEQTKIAETIKQLQPPSDDTQLK